MSDHPTGVYVKDGHARLADTPAKAVAAVWDGYKLSQTAPDADYRDLQEQAKELGIPANQSRSALEQAINAKLDEPSDPVDES